MAVRIFLLVCALVWLPYGLLCWFDPSSLAESAGVASTSLTGTIELRAMYGGLEAALGVLAGLAVLRPRWMRSALAALAFVCTGLFLGRLLGTGLEGEVSRYTAFALAFELVSAALATWFVTRLHEPTAA